MVKVAYDGHHGFLTIVTIPLQEENYMIKVMIADDRN